MKQEKNDKVSLNISQTAIVLIIAMVFTGLSIQIARFHSHSGRRAYARVKNTCAGTLAENGRGAYSRGGRNSAILRYLESVMLSDILVIHVSLKTTVRCI